MLTFYINLHSYHNVILCAALYWKLGPQIIIERTEEQPWHTHTNHTHTTICCTPLNIHSCFKCTPVSSSFQWKLFQVKASLCGKWRKQSIPSNTFTHFDLPDSFWQQREGLCVWSVCVCVYLFNKKKSDRREYSGKISSRPIPSSTSLSTCKGIIIFFMKIWT